MTQNQLNSFITILVNDAAAATPDTEQATVMWQFKKALRQMCKAVAANQNLTVREVVDTLTVNLNTASAQLNLARAQAKETVAETYASQVNALVAAAEADVDNI